MIRYALASAAALALAGCQQTTTNEAVNTDAVNQVNANIDSAASDASNDAATAEAQALGNQEAELANEKAATNGTNPSDADEQNVAGM